MDDRQDHLGLEGVGGQAVRFIVHDERRAEDLIESPATVVRQYCEIGGIEFMPESLTWKPEFKPEWKSWESWHLDAAKSTGFNKGMEDFGFTVNDVPRLKEMYEKCMPYYQAMYDERIRP